MLDIPSITGLVATIGIFVGVALAYLEIRSLVQTRKTELIHGIFQSVNRREFLESWEKFKEHESLGYKDYRKRYGLIELNMVLSTFNEMGFLLSEKLMDIDTVHKIIGHAVKMTWEKMELFHEDYKKIDPQQAWAFEYLYNEIQKREQKLQQTQQ